MNRVFLLMAGLCLALSGIAQNDTAHTPLAVSDTTHGPQSASANGAPNDTIRVGNLIIVRNGRPSWDEPEVIRIRRRHNDYKPSNISTNWGILDLGFANYNDRTNYASAGAQQFAPGAT